MNPENSQRVIAPLPYTSRIDRHGDVRMSSHTALITDAAITRANEAPEARIFIAGESTFGPALPSTADLMRAQMIRKGISAERIIAVGNANDTESQLQAIKDHGIENPEILALDFHIGRTEMLGKQLEMPLSITQAEGIVLRGHKGATPEKVKKVVDTKSKILGISTVHLFEGIARNATRLGKPGKSALRFFRKVTKSDGPTVTDYHNLTSARAHLKKAVENGIINIPSQA